MTRERSEPNSGRATVHSLNRQNSFDLLLERSGFYMALTTEKCAESSRNTSAGLRKIESADISNALTLKRMVRGRWIAALKNLVHPWCLCETREFEEVKIICRLALADLRKEISEERMAL
jgi:hypothetical protein